MKGTERMKSRIKAYLDDFAEKNEGFFFDYQNPDKNLDECVDFICTQVKNMGAEGLDDDDVYGLAIHYYQESDPGEIKKGIAASAKVVIDHRVELTEEEKRLAREQAIRDLAEAEKRKILEKEKREKEAAKKRAEEKAKELASDGVLSLF